MITTVFGADQAYRKLATRLLPIGSSRLLEGRDHLLHIELRGVHEVQRRFYYREIQAITVQPTRTGTVLHFLFGSSAAVLALSLAGVLFSGSPLLAKLVQPIIAVLVIVAGVWLIHFLRGPTCSCQLITGVQSESIPALWRLAVTSRAVERLAPRIEAAQSDLETAPALATETPQPTPGQVPLFDIPVPAPRVNAKWGRPMAMALFSICLANAAVLFANLLKTHAAFAAAETILLLALLGVPLLTVVGNRANGLLRLLGWVALVFSVLTFLGWYSVQLAEVLTTNQTPGPVWNVGISPYQSRYTLWMTVGSAIWGLALGLAGWLVIVLQNASGPGNEPAAGQTGGGAEEDARTREGAR